jgi:hypothetical protein
MAGLLSLEIISKNDYQGKKNKRLIVPAAGGPKPARMPYVSLRRAILRPALSAGGT